MQQSRRAYLRGVGGVALGIGLAGCSGDSQSNQTSGGGSGESGGTGGEDSAGSSGASGTGGSETAAEKTEKTPGTDPAATDLSGNVGNKMASGLTFVEHNHYSMNGIEGVVGRVKNTGGAPLDSVTVHTTVKPGEKGPYTEELEEDDPLKPGDTWRFKYKFGDDAPDEVEGYTIWATGEKA